MKWRLAHPVQTAEGQKAPGLQARKSSISKTFRKPLFPREQNRSTSGRKATGRFKRKANFPEVFAACCGNMAGTRPSRCLPRSLSVRSFLHDPLSGLGRNPVYLAKPRHGVAGFQHLRRALGLPHLLHPPLIQRLETAGEKLAGKEHLPIGMGPALLQESQMQVRPSVPGAAALRASKIREIVVAVRGAMDAVFRHVLAQLTYGFALLVGCAGQLLNDLVVLSAPLVQGAGGRFKTSGCARRLSGYGWP